MFPNRHKHCKKYNAVLSSLELNMIGSFTNTGFLTETRRLGKKEAVIYVTGKFSCQFEIRLSNWCKSFKRVKDKVINDKLIRGLFRSPSDINA